MAVLALAFLASPIRSQVAERPRHEAYDALLALRLNPDSVYRVKPSNRIEIVRGDVRLAFEEGKIAFLAPWDGKVTGLVFSGRGHVLAMPREQVEKQQMARFLDSPVLDELFTSALIRFTDSTSGQLLGQFARESLQPEPDSSLISQWDPIVAQFNSVPSLRILFGPYGEEKLPFFYANVNGVVTGAFDILLDPQRKESFVLGQTRKTTDGTFYDVWASYRIGDEREPTAPFHASEYVIDTTILPDNSLNASAAVHLHAVTGGERVLPLQLSRSLSVTSATDDLGESLDFFQNEGLNPQERHSSGNDSVYVVLSKAPAKGTDFTVRLRYHGNIIEDAGNGVLFVSARETWYPHLGGTADFALYDLSMRWPKRLRLVATGVKLDEHEEGDSRVGHWKTDKPAAVAGFNLGDYASASEADGAYTVDVYANRTLERGLNRRLAIAPPDIGAPLPYPFGGPRRTLRMDIPEVAPSPADALKSLSRDVDKSIHFYETFSGPFPYKHLSVSQIPGSFGQGWPGLLYLSTFSFLPASAQERAGLSTTGQEHFTELVPYHEVAHQWWGNIVGWASYRDQWIDEALASYLSLLFADSQKNEDRSLNVWLERFRTHLLEKVPGNSATRADIGPLTMGSRLTSSKSPMGFEEVVYPKGAWIFHMLREMLRDPHAKNPDERFVSLLRTLSEKYAYRALSTDDLQHEVEAVMTPSMDVDGEHNMDWFFEEWVRGTGVPRYRVEFKSRPYGKHLVVRGKVLQSAVPESFVQRVPLYGVTASGHRFLLGDVLVSGSETAFHFVATSAPRKVLIDPHMTVLCGTE